MREYPCPQCQTNIHWRSDNAYRPFCSERCQQLDLGAWAQEDYAIAGDDNENDASTGVLDPSEENI
ncbi:MAG: DNA gyrase inhibitor YacG [Gammaproteobacteria bacterium]|jgi:hypothetical protein|nr:DNA gyrase inhibitor YacG [Gammaproteobacteria bacterium]MCP4880452.1 DNA gyrase inhibitor YacG [Gammaproteobacteria bacterium]MDP6165975.1 DNA gyrase inhibitor YacG [Gammaproteobacteria bacterium]